MEEKGFTSALSVQEGIEQPPSVSTHSVDRFIRKQKKEIRVAEFVDGILSGNRTLLSQAITLIESSLPAHYKKAQEIIEKCLPHAGKSVRIGITGVPGVGKSTFIEALGIHITKRGKKLAVLAIDPSSERSKGSILGDKTRMEQLSVHPNAFIRPSPSAGSLGGVARKTRETIILCEAAGFDSIFIETVGVGQSETAVHSMTDFFLLLMLAGAGDELQGIKRGIMEMADSIAITKADGSNIQKAGLAASQYRNALHLFPKGPSNWEPPVLLCSAVAETGISEIWDTIVNYIEHTQKNSFFNNNRREQAKYWMYETINESLRSKFYHHQDIEKEISGFEQLVLDDKLSSFAAAKQLLQKYFKHIIDNK